MRWGAAPYPTWGYLDPNNPDAGVKLTAQNGDDCASLGHKPRVSSIFLPCDPVRHAVPGWLLTSVSERRASAPSKRPRNQRLQLRVHDTDQTQLPRNGGCQRRYGTEGPAHLLHGWLHNTRVLMYRMGVHHLVGRLGHGVHHSWLPLQQICGRQGRGAQVMSPADAQLRELSAVVVGVLG